MGVSLKNDNRGLSLVEVMVVVAIMAVVGAVGIMGINAMSGKPAQRTSQQIIYSLEKHRTSAMGKVNAKYELCVDGDEVVAKEYLTNEDTFGKSPTNIYKLGDSSIKVSYWCEGDTDATQITSGSSLTLQFDRSTGAFKKQSGDVFCTKITVERGGRAYNITLVPLTGKVYAEN